MGVTGDSDEVDQHSAVMPINVPEVNYIAALTASD
jgi:hypothetical protein